VGVAVAVAGREGTAGTAGTAGDCGLDTLAL